MSTGITVSCPSCASTYKVPNERAGARFKCKKCGTSVLVPTGVPTTEVERPIVQPAELAAKPVVQPSKPVVQPAKPVVAPKAPSQKPVVAPAAPSDLDLGAADEGVRKPPEANRQHTRVHAAQRPDFSQPKKGPGKIIAAVVGVVVVGAVIFFMTRGGNDPKPTPGPNDKGAAPVAQTPDKPQAPVYDAAKTITELRTEIGDKSADQLWKLSKKLQAQGDAWKEKGAPPEAVTKLTDEAIICLDKVVELDPSHAEARAARNEVKYSGELDPYVNAKYVTESDRELVRQNNLQVSVKAKETNGWISRSMFDSRVKPILDRYTKIRADYEEMEASPFGEKARALEKTTIDDLSKIFQGKLAFEAYVQKPYMVFVEVSPSWSPQNEANSRFNELQSLNRTYMKEFAALNLKPVEQPIPVLYFTSPERYEEYNKGTGKGAMKALAHFEPDTGRLVLNRNVDHEVVLHEGTHQLFARYSETQMPFALRSYWFQEGVAEYFGGSNRWLDKNNEWFYEVGVLQMGRLGSIRTYDDKLFTLGELLSTTYTNKGIWEKSGSMVKIELVYAQGWFLIYFLNNFNVDAKGLVQVGARGKYKDGWDRYVRGELAGKTGKKAFMEALGLADDAALAALEKEYRAYFEFVNHKANIGQVKDKKLVPWKDYVNKRGEKTGEEADDMLVKPPK